MSNHYPFLLALRRLATICALNALLVGMPVAVCFITGSSHHSLATTKRRNATTSAPGSSWLRPGGALFMSLKPAALPLMDSGKALARSGELLIDLTAAMDLYGGGLSSVGALIRNAGDNVAQAAASCRFKTGRELVCDELRLAADCLSEATGKLRLAAEEAALDDKTESNDRLAPRIDAMVRHVNACSIALEEAGASIMQRKTVDQVGVKLSAGGSSLEPLSALLTDLQSDRRESVEAGQRMAFAAKKMIQAGDALQGIKPSKSSGKSWLKGG